MDTVEEANNEADAREARLDSQTSLNDPQYKEILHQYRQRLVKDPRNVSLLNEVGLAAEMVGDIDRALWAYKRAIRLEPDYAESYRNLGLLYRREGREEQAAHALQQYVRWAGDEADLSLAQQKTGQVEDKRGIETVRSVDESPVYARLSQVWDEMGLTPAEAMLLLDPENSSGLKMMQYTLLDLIAKGVLEADSRQKIGRGEGYGKSDLAPHEALLAKYFSRISDYVDVDKLARAALAELDDDGDAYKAAYVRAALLRKGFVELETKRIAGFLPVQVAVPSKKGALARNRLQRLLSEADRQLARSLADDPQQANAYVEKGGPALLLMDGYPSRHFKRWHEILTRIGFGPTITKLRGKARQSTLGAYAEDILKTLLGG
ncbi:MAG: tetratricopeptide repeat protein [Chloroflexota bacterium]|jgi:tetratricopeptide (TPR) repeat protein